MSLMNRLGNCHNHHQGSAKKVLCLCSAGLLRSPTAAIVLAGEPFNFNTRAAGVSSEFALIRVDEVLLEWADEIVCMEKSHADGLQWLAQNMDISIEKPIVILGIPDRFKYRDPELMKLIAKNYKDSEIMAQAQDEKR